MKAFIVAIVLFSVLSMADGMKSAAMDAIVPVDEDVDLKTSVDNKDRSLS